MQHPSLRAVYFAPDLAMQKENMDPHNYSQTDVCANIKHVLRQLWGHLYDFKERHDPAFCTERRDASIDNALRKYMSPSVHASALVLCQHLPEAARVLDEGNLHLDACVLSSIFDVSGLCPRFELKDGPCVGAAGYMIKAFSTRVTAAGPSLLPTGHDSTIDLCSYLALALDASHNLSLPLQTILPSSHVSIQLLAYVFVHLFRSRQTGAIFSFPVERAVQLRLDPARSQPIALSGGCRYLEEMCSYVAKYFEDDSKGDPLHLVEAARMYAAQPRHVEPIFMLMALPGTNTQRTTKSLRKCLFRLLYAASLFRINMTSLWMLLAKQAESCCALKLPRFSNSRWLWRRRPMLPL